MADKIGKRISIYMRNDQLEYLDKMAEEQKVTRSKYIEQKVFPPELQRLQDKRGKYER